MLTGGTRCGVIGSPIGHSLSPVLHLAAYRSLGLDWDYDAHDVRVEGVAGFVAGLGADWRGLSVTRPLKEAVLDLADEIVEPAARLRAANTLVRVGARGGWEASNTDVAGFVGAWREAGLEQASTAVVLGAGATARSALAALRQIGVDRVAIAVRDRSRAAEIVALGSAMAGLRLDVVDLADGPRSDVDLVVSTIPAEAQRAGVLAFAAKAQVVSDAVYDPPVTPLLTTAGRVGAVVVDGFGLLLHQAGRQVERMTGLAAPLEAMRVAGVEALVQRRESGHE